MPFLSTVFDRNLIIRYTKTIAAAGNQALTTRLFLLRQSVYNK